MIGWVCLQLCTVQCAVHCVQCTALQCSVVHYSVVYLCVQWSALQCGTLWCSAVQCDYKYQKGSQPIHQLQVLQETVEYIHCTHFSAVLTLYPNDNTLVPTPQCCNFTKVVIPMITCSYQIPSSVISEITCRFQMCIGWGSVSQCAVQCSTVQCILMQCSAAQRVWRSRAFSKQEVRAVTTL